MMKLRLAHPEALIDINGLAELASIGWSRACVCALVGTPNCCFSPRRLALPILHDAERVIADPIVRNRGTVGGSLCQADPSEISPPRSLPCGRTWSLSDFRDADHRRSFVLRRAVSDRMEHGELLVEIQVPVGSPAGAYLKVDRRAGDWAVGRLVPYSRSLMGGASGRDRVDRVGASRLSLPGGGLLCVVAGVGGAVHRGGRIAAAHCNPVADQRGPVAYKRHLAGELTVRALRLAAGRVV